MALALPVLLLAAWSLAWATYSLWFRRRYPGVGAVAGGIVIALATFGFGVAGVGAAWRRLVPDPSADPGDLATAPPGEIATFALIVLGVAGGAVLLGLWQNRCLGTARGMAVLNGLGLLFVDLMGLALFGTALSLVMDDRMTSYGVPESVLLLVAALMVAAEIVAPLIVAPLIVARLPRGRRYPRTFQVPPEP